MLKALLRKKSGDTAQVVERKFAPQYLLSDKHHAEYVQNGYTVIRNCVDAADIEHMISVYERMSKMDGFDIGESFVNSGRFSSTEIRNFVVSEITEVSGRIISAIADISKCASNAGGSFQIKPPSKQSMLNPHQDTPIIDETQFYATYVWIPLCDMTEENGTLCVLPGSHTWGNHQRSLNVDWIYEKHTRFLWEKMEPVTVYRGDVICFDSAIIHSSLNNLTDDIRLAYTTALLPRDFQLVHYFRDDSTPANEVDVYGVDEAFFYSCDIMQRPPEPYRKLRTETWKGAKKVSRADIKQLIEATSN